MTDLPHKRTLQMRMHALSLRTKLLGSYLLLSVICLIPFALISLIRASQLSERSTLYSARQAMEQADVILSKGMGNVETLLGCGKNIYYAFLVKCQRFVNLMERPLMTPLLLRELDRRG